MFKLNNPLVVLDLEATAGKDAKGNQTNNFIIDIGAVLLDEELNERDSFDRLVRPEEAITPFIENLTGISPKMVQGSPLFPVVAEEFESWLEETAGCSLKKIRLCAWGNYFDIPLLRRVYQFYDRPFPYHGAALDVRTLAFLWNSLSLRRTDRLSLDGAASDMGLSRQGRKHRALADARQTAAVLQRVWVDLQGIFLPTGKGSAEAFLLQPATSEKDTPK